jgi:hypothetical protein
MEVNEDTKQFPMMRGTSGDYNYLVVGRRGNYVLGIKPEAIVPGQMFKVPKALFLGPRARCRGQFGA